MRIGIDASNIRGGGGLIHLSEILKYCEPKKHGIEKIIVWGGKNLDEIPDKNFIEKSYQGLLDRGLIFRVWWSVTRLTSLAKKNCDLLFVPGGIYLGSFRPYVTMAQNLLPFDYDTRKLYKGSSIYIRLRILEKVLKFTFRRANGIIFLSEKSKSIIKSRIKHKLKNETLIPHGISKEFVRTEDEEKKYLQRVRNKINNGHTISILYVSGIRKYKNHLELVKKIKKLRDEGLNIDLKFVGRLDKNYKKIFLKDLNKIDQTGKIVSMVGEVPYSEIKNYYEDADFFAFPSLCESFGLPASEADGFSLIRIDNAENKNDIINLINHGLKNKSIENIFWSDCSNRTFNYLKGIG